MAGPGFLSFSRPRDGMWITVAANRDPGLSFCACFARSTRRNPVGHVRNSAAVEII